MDRLHQFISEILHTKLSSQTSDAVRQCLAEVKSRDDQILSAANLSLSREVSQGVTISSSLLLEIIYQADPAAYNQVAAVALLQIHNRNSESCVESYAVTALTVLHHLSDEFLIEELFLEIATLSEYVTNYFCHNNKPKVAVPSIKRIVEVYASRIDSLTPIHVQFLQLCIKAKLYSVALRFINAHEVLEVDPEKTNVNIEDILRYFYYCGICYCAEKNFQSALNAFVTVLSIPAQQAVSKIAEEALKKCKLISLIESAKKFEVPKSVSSAISRFAAENTRLYDDIASHFVNSTYETLAHCISSAQEALERELNLGLAKQVLPAWRRNKLRLLSQTFVTLSLAEVEKYLGFIEQSECERFIVATVQKDGLKASIDVSQALVYFSDEDEQTADHQAVVQFANQLDLSMKEIAALTDRLKAAQVETLTSQHYIMKATTSSNVLRGPSLSSSMMGSSMMEFSGSF